MTLVSNSVAGAQETTRSLTGARRRGRFGREAILGYALFGPALVLLFALQLIPGAAVFLVALTDWQFGAPDLSFVGFENFIALFADPTFRVSLGNTVLYSLVVVPGTVALGLLLALAIEGSGALKPLYRAAHFLPVMATMAAMALAWEALLHPTIGMVNQLVGVVGIGPRNWLHDPDLVLPVLMVLGIWQHVGLTLVLFLAGLKGIPRDLYDAADVDGADGPLDRFLSVTWPMLGPVTMFVVIIIALRAFELFDTVKVLTKGGPGTSSEVLLHTLYVESFEYLRTGYGAAVTVVFLVIVLSLTWLQARVMDRRVHYQ